MRTHNGHWSRLHFHDALADGALPALVFAGARLRAAASVLHEESAGSLPRRLSTADVIGTLKSHSAASSAGTGADELSWGIARTIRLSERALATLLDNRIIIVGGGYRYRSLCRLLCEQGEQTDFVLDSVELYLYGNFLDCYF